MVTAPHSLLEDLLDCLTVARCEQVFSFMEARRSVWVASPFDKAVCSNKLLRICNSLQRRLSRTQDTVFCGRILMFLASVTPLSDKSGEQ